VTYSKIYYGCSVISMRRSLETWISGNCVGLLKYVTDYRWVSERTHFFLVQLDSLSVIDWLRLYALNALTCSEFKFRPIFKDWYFKAICFTLILPSNLRKTKVRENAKVRQLKFEPASLVIRLKQRLSRLGKLVRDYEKFWHDHENAQDKQSGEPANLVLPGN